jgi:hypothetical protein
MAFNFLLLRSLRHCSTPPHTPHHRVTAMPPPRRKRKAAPSEPRRRPPSRLEFRATVDGAWYEARVAVQCDALRVMYEEFLEEQDEWYDPAALAASSARDVAKFRARFRVPSTPLEDTQCRDLQAGARLCVSCSLDGGDLKFYDAVLGSVRSFYFILAHNTQMQMTTSFVLFLVWRLRFKTVRAGHVDAGVPSGSRDR